jgi:threonine 3-dehydrogenase
MKALIKSRREPGIWLGELPKPEPGPNDVLIRMRKTAICGTDIHIWQWDTWAQRTIPVPMQIGHEYCGEIVAIGSEVRGLAVRRPCLGRGAHHLRPLPQLPRRTRHLCRNTSGVGVNRPGCFAEYIVHSRVERVPAADGDPRRDRLDLDPLGNADAPRSRSTSSARTC